MAVALAQRPDRGGHAWVVLQYLLGLRRLGWRVTLVDRLPADQCRDRSGAPVAAERSVGARYAHAVLAPFLLDRDYFLLVDGEADPVGHTRSDLRQRVRDADFVLNVMGFLDDEDLLGAARRLAFLDIDPGFPQMWAELGQADVVSGHDVHLSVGANVGRDGCGIPTLGLAWRPTLPPVVLDCWPRADGPGRAVTSVATWRGPFGPVERGGERFGLRVHEFRRFADVALDPPQPMELALDIDDGDGADRDRLERCGWRLVDPVSVAGDPDAYRRYVQDSSAELQVAKGMYVQTRSGWFSDRSACYLASGRPVVAQDTGLGGHLPLGDGLLVFDTAEEARSGLEDVVGRPAHHAAAARAIAEDVLDSDRVLSGLVDAVMEAA